MTFRPRLPTRVVVLGTTLTALMASCSPASAFGGPASATQAPDTGKLAVRATITRQRLFATRREVGAGWNVMNALVGSGDVDYDGRPDLLARDRATGTLRLHPGNGAGGFASRRSLGAGWGTFTAFAGPRERHPSAQPQRPLGPHRRG